MLVAIFGVHWPYGFFASSNGIELPLMYLTAALALAFAGPGAYALDRAFSVMTLTGPAATWIAIWVAVGLALASVALRRPTPARTHV